MSGTRPTGVKGFDQFWQAWPKHFRKAGKARCLKLWKKRQLEGRTQAILAVLEAYKRSRQWRKQRGQFVPAPDVWLHQYRYDADPDDVAGEDSDETMLSLVPDRDPSLDEIEFLFGKEAIRYYEPE